MKLKLEQNYILCEAYQMWIERSAQQLDFLSIIQANEKKKPL